MRKIIKIGLLVSGLPPTRIGGVEIATHYIAKSLSKKHLEVHVITRNIRIKVKGKPRSLKKIEIYKGYIIHRIPCSNFPIFRFITHVLFGLIALIKIKPDIIHSQQLTPNGFIAVLGGKILKRKTVVCVHGSEIHDSSLLYLKTLGNFIISQASIVLGVSKYITNRMKLIWPQKSTFILHNGIELQDYFRNLTPKSTIELIFIGRLIEIKRVSDAINAIAELKDDFPNLRLTIVGSGPAEKSLKKISSNLSVKNFTRFIGEISHKKVPKYLSKADIFIFTSPKEGFPTVLLEAMASGLPILAPKSTAIPELVHNHVNGFLYSPGNNKELIENLKILMKDNALRKLMGENSQKLAKIYSWKKIINQLIKFYFNFN
ncbi:MAG: glycosyltransferase family 4 protein [Promethearchaeota archaeon]